MTKNRLFTPFAVAMIAIIVVCTVAEFIFSDDHTLTLVRCLAIAGAILGVTNCVLSSDGSIWNYLAGVPAVVFQGIVSLHEGNIGIGCMALAFLAPMQIIGYFMWKRNGASLSSDADEATVKARRLNWWMRVLVAVVIAVCSYALGLVLRHFGANSPWLDAAAVVMQIVAQILMTFVFMEQWAIWIVVNAVYMSLWAHTLWIHIGEQKPLSNDVVMIAMWVCYFVISIHGFRVWHHLSKSSDSQ